MSSSDDAFLELWPSELREAMLALSAAGLSLREILNAAVAEDLDLDYLRAMAASLGVEGPSASEPQGSDQPAATPEEPRGLDPPAATRGNTTVCACGRSLGVRTGSRCCVRCPYEHTPTCRKRNVDFVAEPDPEGTTAREGPAIPGYLVLRTPRNHERLLGVHHLSWRALCAFLSAQTGSPCPGPVWYTPRSNTVALNQELWTAEGHPGHVVYHTPL